MSWAFDRKNTRLKFAKSFAYFSVLLLALSVYVSIRNDQVGNSLLAETSDFHVHQKKCFLYFVNQLAILNVQDRQTNFMGKLVQLLGLNPLL